MHKIKSIKEQGITLIALVVTIIVLVILAGITISILFEKNGLVEKAKNATEEYKIEEQKQKLQLAIYNLNIERQNTKIDLQELINIKENGIKVLTTENRVKIFQDNLKKYAIVTVNKYSFKVYEDMEIVYFNEFIEEDELSEIREKYVQDGLIVWYDGVCNNGQTHDNNAKIWKNLVNQNENNGNLMNFDYNDQSGWTENSLILDGKNDWVKMSYLYSENMTIEIVAKPLKETLKSYTYLANYQYGGMGIEKTENTKSNEGLIYSNSKYNYISSKENNEICKIYSMSTGNNGNRKYFSQNGNINYTDEVGIVGTPANNTVFAIGTNPNGDSYKIDSSKEEFAKIEVYSVRIYNRCLSEEEVRKNYESDCERFKLNKEKFDVSNLGYVEDGLICLYDGEHNNFYNHDNKISNWVDLTNNNNNGKLMKFDYNAQSGWTNNSLILDGKNDYVQMTYMHNSNITIELVFKPIALKNNKYECYLANCEDGGMAIAKETTKVNSVGTYIGGSYKYLYSPNIIEENKVYSLSTGYNGSEQFFMENGQYNSKIMTGTYKKPDSSTVFMLGTNPSGKEAGDDRTNMEVYSVRIYNRCLSKEEIIQNYKIDKQRFSI